MQEVVHSQGLIFGTVSKKSSYPGAATEHCCRSFHSQAKQVAYENKATVTLATTWMPGHRLSSALTRIDLKGKCLHDAARYYK